MFYNWYYRNGTHHASGNIHVSHIFNIFIYIAHTHTKHWKYFLVYFVCRCCLIFLYELRLKATTSIAWSIELEIANWWLDRFSARAMFMARLLFVRKVLLKLAWRVNFINFLISSAIPRLYNKIFTCLKWFNCINKIELIYQVSFLFYLEAVDLW